MVPERWSRQSPAARAGAWTTSPSGLSRKRERPGCRPVSHPIGAVSAEQNFATHSVRGPGTDSTPRWSLCALDLSLSAIANVRPADAGDDLQSGNPPPDWAADPAVLVRESVVSHAAIAAAIALRPASTGEQLTALSLASFANREHRAWPGARIAAARAGLSRSQYLACREALERRGHLRVHGGPLGRGQSQPVTLVFAATGPWCDDELNPVLLDVVLSHSQSRGSARVMLATLAALADGAGRVHGVSTEDLCQLAGVEERTYRRARSTLLASGELTVTQAGGGRARSNEWLLPDPRSANPSGLTARARRPITPASARPLLRAIIRRTDTPAETAPPNALGAPGGAGNPGQDGALCDQNPGQDRTLSALERPGLTGVSALNPGQDRTLFEETPAQTPAQTPAPDARAGREPQNPRIRTDPPNPPEGGCDGASVLIEEGYVTGSGRRRRRPVRVDLDEVRRELRTPGVDDRRDWAEIRERLRDLVGSSVFEIWLERLELVAVDSAGRLVVAGPIEITAWVKSRFGQALSASAGRLDREVRLADERERMAVGRDGERGGDLGREVVNQQEVS
jgi:hypothetical protein